MDVAQIQGRLAEKFGAEAIDAHTTVGQTRFTVPRQIVFDLLETLRDDPEMNFEMLVDLHGQDYLHYRGATDRFAVIYQVANIEENVRLWIRVLLNEPELVLPSVTPLWSAADWLERECHDMFGIVFDDHPDPRPLLLPDDFKDHPLRKDYPLRGKGERHNFAQTGR